MYEKYHTKKNLRQKKYHFHQTHHTLVRKPQRNRQGGRPWHRWQVKWVLDKLDVKGWSRLICF